jgi:tetratricopeptide (TPR) repeat protein
MNHSHLHQGPIQATSHTGMPYKNPVTMTPPKQSSNSQIVWVVVAVIAAILIIGVPVGIAVYRVARTTLASKSLRLRGLPHGKSNFEGTLAGLKIVGVQADSPAALTGLKYGDILVAYDGRPVTNEDEISEVIDYAERHRVANGGVVELALYRDGDMTIRTLRIPVGRMGVYTREWTFAYAFVDDAIMQRNNYAEAEAHANQAEKSGHYTRGQLLHMRVLCVNNEKDGDAIRQQQVTKLYDSNSADEVTLFGNYDLLYNKRFRAAAAIFERYMDKKHEDVSTELNLAACYTELDRYDDAQALVNRVLARPEGDENAPSSYGLSVLSNIQGKIQMGHHQYDRAQERFLAALERYPGDSYYVLAYLYCAAQRDVNGQKPGEFENAYKTISAQLSETRNVMGYHLDALRAFVLVRQNRKQEAGPLVQKWANSADAKRYIPVFWSRFPEGSNIIDNWNSLLPNP